MHAYATGNNLSIADSIVDSGAILAGFGGALGFTFSASYGITDATFWPALSAAILILSTIQTKTQLLSVIVQIFVTNLGAID